MGCGASRSYMETCDEEVRVVAIRGTTVLTTARRSIIVDPLIRRAGMIMPDYPLSNGGLRVRVRAQEPSIFMESVSRSGAFSEKTTECSNSLEIKLYFKFNMPDKTSMVKKFINDTRATVRLLSVDETIRSSSFDDDRSIPRLRSDDMMLHSVSPLVEYIQTDSYNSPLQYKSRSFTDSELPVVLDANSPTGRNIFIDTSEFLGDFPNLGSDWISVGTSVDECNVYKYTRYDHNIRLSQKISLSATILESYNELRARQETMLNLYPSACSKLFVPNSSVKTEIVDFISYPPTRKITPLMINTEQRLFIFSDPFLFATKCLGVVQHMFTRDPAWMETPVFIVMKEPENTLIIQSLIANAIYMVKLPSATVDFIEIYDQSSGLLSFAMIRNIVIFETGIVCIFGDSYCASQSVSKRVEILQKLKAIPGRADSINNPTKAQRSFINKHRVL